MFNLIQEMQIKTTMSYHFTPIRVAIKKKKGNIISASKDAEKLDPSIPFLGMLTKELKAETQILVCQWSKHYLQ